MTFEKIETYAIRLGNSLGFYDAFAVHGALSAAELAACTGTHVRYVHHWLEQQAEAGFVEAAQTTDDSHRFRVTSGLAALLTGRGEAASFLRRLW